MTNTKGLPAAAWFYAQSFHQPRTQPAPAPCTPVQYVDTRPRVDYVLPDGTTVPIIHDHDQVAQPSITFQLKGGKIVDATRADLAVRS